MIDTHAHLSEKFEEEVDLEKLDWVVLAASNLEDSKDNLELAKINKKLLPAVGIHPMEKISVIGEQISVIEKMLKDNRNIVAVGECGLELTDGVDKEKQIELFRRQIELAMKYDKALIVHSRGASDETVEILKDYKNLRGVIHCYTGGKKRIKKYLEVSDEWYFGIDGNLTYEAGLEEVVKNIPKDRLVAETDTPYLAPVPHRGETNRPEWVEFVYRKIGDIWGISFEETERMIDQNARRLFARLEQRR